MSSACLYIAGHMNDRSVFNIKHDIRHFYRIVDNWKEDKIFGNEPQHICRQDAKKKKNMYSFKIINKK